MTLRRYTIYAARHVNDEYEPIPVVTLRIIRTASGRAVEHSYTLRERDLVRALRDAGFVIGATVPAALTKDDTA